MVSIASNASSNASKRHLCAAPCPDAACHRASRSSTLACAAPSRECAQPTVVLTQTPAAAESYKAQETRTSAAEGASLSHAELEQLTKQVLQVEGKLADIFSKDGPIPSVRNSARHYLLASPAATSIIGMQRSWWPGQRRSRHVCPRRHRRCNESACKLAKWRSPHHCYSCFNAV